MKNNIIHFSIYLSLLIVAVFAKRSPKIAYVESAKVLETYKEMQLARAAYRQHAEVWQANLDTLKNTVQREVDAYSHARKGLSPLQQRDREGRLLQRQRQYLSYKKAISQQAAVEESRATAEVVRKADQLMKQYGEEQGYDIVFAATESGGIVYSKDDKNITSEVIKYINSHSNN